MIKGIEKVKAALLRIKEQKLRQFSQGLKKAGLLIQRESQKVFVPVDYGNLKATAFTRCENENTKNPKVKTGYTAKYAIYVHEIRQNKHGTIVTHGAEFNAKHAVALAIAHDLRMRRLGGTKGPYRHYRKDTEQWKFLERPFREQKKNVLAIIAAEVAK